MEGIGFTASNIAAFIGFAASVIVAFVGGYYLSKVESTKSRLKKTEMLFELRMAAAREFNEICQKYDPLNLGEIYNGDIRGPKRWKEIRKSISEYRAQYGYVFEGDKINATLEKILSSLDYSANSRYIFHAASGDCAEADAYEENYYKDTLILMSEANDMMRKYLFEEAKR